MTEFCTTYHELTFEWTGSRQPREPDVGIMSAYTDDITLDRILLGDKVLWEFGKGASTNVADLGDMLLEEVDIQAAFDETYDGGCADD